MSRLVDQEHWEFWMGDMPKPEGTTLEMMYAAYDALQAIKEEEEDVRLLTWYQRSKEYYEKKLQRVQNERSLTDNYEQRVATLKGILDTIEEGIQILTERLIR